MAGRIWLLTREISPHAFHTNLPALFGVFVLVLIDSNKLLTIPVGLSCYLNQDPIPYAFQRCMVSGLAMGL